MCDFWLPWPFLFNIPSTTVEPAPDNWTCICDFCPGLCSGHTVDNLLAASVGDLFSIQTSVLALNRHVEDICLQLLPWLSSM